MLEISIHGSRRRTTESIADLKRIRSGQMVASFNLEVYGSFYVRQMLLIRRNNDVLFIRGSDYPDPNGPRAHHRLFHISSQYERHLLSQILPMIRAEIETDGCVDTMDEYLLHEQQILQPIDPVDLGARCTSLATAELVRPGKVWLLPERMREVVGYAHFNIAELCSVWECPIVLDRGLFFVKSPFQRGSFVRPAAIEDLMRQEMTSRVRQRLREFPLHRVPQYLQGCARALSAQALERDTASHDRLSFIAV